MDTDFERFVSAQLDAISRDIGAECRDDLNRENLKVMEWIEKNAARFRAEWMRANARAGQEWRSRCDGAS